MVGCGGYANNCGAAATTGPGEAIMKLTLARDVVFMMENGKNAQVMYRDVQFWAPTKFFFHGIISDSTLVILPCKLS